MKKTFLLLNLLLSTCIITNAQVVPDPNEIVSLFGKAPTQVSQFLLSKGFSYNGKDDDFYDYTAGMCNIQIGYKAGKLNTLLIQQPIGNYYTEMTILHDKGFVMTKAYPGGVTTNPVPIPIGGGINCFDNKTLSIRCCVMFPVVNNDLFTMTYSHMRL